MADFVNDLIANNEAEWNEVDLEGLGLVIGSVVTIQAKEVAAKLFFGPVKPSNDDEGVHVPRENWPLYEGVVTSKIFWRGRRIHLSEGS